MVSIAVKEERWTVLCSWNISLSINVSETMKKVRLLVWLTVTVNHEE